MKLESLKDRPATKEDIGKIVYDDKAFKFKILATFGKGDPQTIIDLEDENGDRNTFRTRHFYWQKPILISEAEYEELKASRQQVAVANHEITRKVIQELREYIEDNEVREYGETGIREYGTVDADLLLQKLSDMEKEV